MQTKLRILVGLILNIAVSPNLAAAQLIQSNGLHQQFIQSEKFVLSKKLLADGQLKTTPINSKHLSLYDRVPKGSAWLANNKNIETAISKKQNNLSVEPGLYRIKALIPPHQYIDDVFEISHEYNIDPLLLHAIAEVESHFNSKAVSPVGARGLMQIMPSTARRFGMSDPKTQLFNPRDNLRICSNYLRTLHNLFGNNIPLILAAYNAGENAVIKYGNTIPPYNETQRYVAKVMKRYLELKDLSYQL
jgi:soluble lytic murein transglycosylase-like protein